MEYKESAIVLIFNDKGQMAMQLRAKHDQKYPSHWDFAAGGGIDPGEDHRTAAIRETKEEVGVDVDVEFVTEELYQDTTRQDRLFIYKARCNGPFTAQPEEVERVEFFNLEEINTMLTSGVSFHPEFPFIWKKGIIASAAK